MDDRSDLIARYFSYLVEDYGYHVDEKEFDFAAMGNAYVVFRSLKLGIQVVIDRNYVQIRAGQAPDRKHDWFEFADILKYYAPEIDNPYIYPEKTPENTWDSIVEQQLSRLSSLLREHCDSLLRSQSLPKKEIKRIEDDRVERQYGRFMRKHPKSG